VYQRSKLYEFSLSTKMLLTGFILTVCAAGVVGVVGFYHACKDADGREAISFEDVKMVVAGARRPVLERAAGDPAAYRLGHLEEPEREALLRWCREGASRSDLPNILRILKDSDLDRSRGGDGSDASKSVKDLAQEYTETAALARCRRPLTRAQRAAVTVAYLAAVSVAFLGLGLMFVQTSLFERTKVFFVAATFVFVALCPICLWVARRHRSFVYPMLLSALLLGVCLGVFALVALYDLWFRRPAA